MSEHAMTWRGAPARNPARGGSTLGVEVMAFFFAVGATWAVSAFAHLAALSYLSIALFFWMISLLFRWEPVGAVLILPFLVFRLLNMWSLAMIESGGLVSELNVYGEAGIYSASYLFYAAMFFFGHCAFVKWIRRIPTPRGELWVKAQFQGLRDYVGWAIVIMVGLAGLYLLQSGARSGFPLLTHMDRFLYRRVFADPVLVVVLNNKPIVSALLGLVAFTEIGTRTTRSLSAVLFVVLCGIYFLFGDKFGTMISNAVFFFLPQLLTDPRGSMRRLLRLLPAIFVGFALLFAATFYIYSGYGALGWAQTWTLIENRMANNAELWFVVNKSGASLFAWDADLIGKTIQSLLVKDPEKYDLSAGLGTFYFIFKYTTPEFVQSILRNQGLVTFTGGYEPLGLVMFGYAGLALVMALTGAISAAVMTYVQRAFKMNSPFHVMASVYLSILAIYAIGQGIPHLILGQGPMKVMGLLAIAELVLLYVANSQMLLAKGHARRAGAH